MASFVRVRRWWVPAAAGLSQASWQSVALILAINTGFAAILWIEDTRPFWHPLITAQCFGLAIAYAVNAASPWESRRPLLRLVLAVAAGTAVGFILLVMIKDYSVAEMKEHSGRFAWTAFSGFTNGLAVSVFFLVKFREARGQAQLLRAEADSSLLARHALQAELKLMQAQVEPHFLFNTLASVQFLIETDPPKAGLMLDHLLSYLRAALPQLRSDGASVGQEIDLAQAYLSIMQMRMGRRLRFSVDVQPELRDHSFPPMMLMSLVENAIKHGLEPKAEGGEVSLQVRRSGDRLVLSVSDTGQGLAAQPGSGIGLSNLRDRLKALYGDAARFALEQNPGSGVTATVEIPYDAPSQVGSVTPDCPHPA